MEKNFNTKTLKIKVHNVDLKDKPYEVLETLTYYHVENIKSEKVIFPISVIKGFRSDGDSIPPFARIFFPVLEKSSKASFIHDYGYALLRNERKNGNNSGSFFIKSTECQYKLLVNRAFFDKIYLTCMKVEKVGFFERNLKFLVVKLFANRYTYPKSMRFKFF